jgi:regulator of replication initiation timing
MARQVDERHLKQFTAVKEENIRLLKENERLQRKFATHFLKRPAREKADRSLQTLKQHKQALCDFSDGILIPLRERIDTRHSLKMFDQ